MIYLSLPVGSFHGWGVCGKYITREMARIGPVQLLAKQCNEENIADPLDLVFLQQAIPPQDVLNDYLIQGQPLPHPMLHAIVSKLMVPREPAFKGRYNVGYTFFEENLLDQEYIQNARKHFDLVVTGSRWCEEVLRQHGLETVRTIIQGVDNQIFNPFDPEKKYFQDRFVIFSGGKFEFRKGQDLVIKAFKILQDQYPDVMLVNSWYNMWDFSLNTMRISPHIKFQGVSGSDYVAGMTRLLVDNGIDPKRVITLGLHPNTAMARVYKNTDVGLFPNRCEGGTNLVMMEYMACGKPVIAANNTGHQDVLTADNAIRLDCSESIRISNGQEDIAVWNVPSLDEVVAKLEWAYHHRDALKPIGQRAGEDLATMTWKQTAQAFYDVLTQAG